MSAKKTIKASVLDSEMQTLSNANVQEVNAAGTVFGNTKTDKDGKFEIALSQPNSLIKISHVGYKTQILQPTDKVLSSYVTLQNDATELAEVVIVGKPKNKKDNTWLWILFGAIGIGTIIYLKSKPSPRKVTI